MSVSKRLSLENAHWPLEAGALNHMISQLTNLLKLRIGVVMMLTALVAMAVTPGPQASVLEMLVLAFAILAAAGAAGAFNQYFEVDRSIMKPTTYGIISKQKKL